eukprot:7288614-Ditylum_brightwellii.AAC.1
MLNTDNFDDIVNALGLAPLLSAPPRELPLSTTLLFYLDARTQNSFAASRLGGGGVYKQVESASGARVYQTTLPWSTFERVDLNTAHDGINI